MNVVNEELIQELNKSIAIVFPAGLSLEELTDQLSACINQLIQTNFQKLITLLYRIDVSEQKLKQLLLQHPDEDAGKIIATLIIERQLQKISTHRQFNQQREDFTGDEKW